MDSEMYQMNKQWEKKKNVGSEKKERWKKLREWFNMYKNMHFLGKEPKFVLIGP